VAGSSFVTLTKVDNLLVEKWEARREVNKLGDVYSFSIPSTITPTIDFLRVPKYSSKTSG